jgi:PAS domain S-box-containing protein
MIDILETERIKDEINATPSAVLEIIETTSDIGICITNDQGNFAAVNEAYTKIYGYTKSELIGNSFLMVVPPTNQENMDHLHRKFLKDKKEISREWEVVRKNGERITISVDTGYSEHILGGGPHKITFVHREY